jgi:hypothetical protein
MPVAKSATLRFYLLYSPIWIAVVAVTLLTQAFAHWRDLGHMLLGVGLGAPIVLWSLFSEPEVPLAERYSLKAALFVTLLAFLQNYFGTPLFFNHFGLTYHFPVTLLGNGSPWFLSFLTMAYFATYCTPSKNGSLTCHLRRFVKRCASARRRRFRTAWRSSRRCRCRITIWRAIFRTPTSSA